MLKFRAVICLSAAMLLLVVFWGAGAAAENATTPGAVTTPHPTIINLAVEWHIRGDDNINGKVEVTFRRVGEEPWHKAMNLRRVPAGKSKGTRSTYPGNPWKNKHSGSIFDLRPGTAYEIHLKLTDPDGGSAEKTVRVRTRPVPGARRAAIGRTFHVAAGRVGGDGSRARPFGSLQQTQRIAKPGDLFLIHPGVYREGLRIERSGNAVHPIVYRGVGPGEAILVGWNRRTSSYDPEVIVDARRARYVHLENLTIGAPHLDVDDAPRVRLADYVGRTIEAGKGRRNGIKANGAKNLVVRYCTIKAVFGFVAYKPGATDCYIADNVIQGTTTWVPAAMGAKGKNIGEGIQFTGPGSVICFNKVTGFRDCISTMEDSDVKDQYCIDIYNNDVYVGADDGIEADFCMHNVRVMRNRLTNCFVGLSSQPGLGGPTYFIRNVMYNLTYAPYKLHRYSIGDVILHNTVVKVGDGMGCFTSQAFDFAYFRNNLAIGGPPGQKWGGYGAGSGMAARLQAHGPNCSFDYDAVGTFQTPFRARIGRKSFSQVEPHGIRIDMNVFNGVEFPVKPVPGHKPPDLRPKAGSKVVDAAVRLANVNDKFLGRAPDIGAYEAGQPLPHYGPRPKGVDELTAYDQTRIAQKPGKLKSGGVWPSKSTKPAGPDEKAVADARAKVKAAADKSLLLFRKVIIEGVKEGKRANVYIDMGGAPLRGKILSADENTIVVRLSGGEIPLPWRKLSLRRFAGIAAKYAGNSADQRVQLAALFAAAGQSEKASDILSAAGAIEAPSKDLAEAIRLLAKAR